MEVILQKDVEHLGSKYEIVKVRPGYARNFLIPRGYALEATPAIKKHIAEITRQRAHKEEKIRKEAEKLAITLSNLPLKVFVKIGEKGKIFGSVSAVHIAQALQQAGYNIEHKKITLDNPSNIKSTGTYTASVRIHKDIIAKINFEVLPEEK